MSFQDYLECNDNLSSIDKSAEIYIAVENKDEECNRTCQQIIGIIFVLIGQVCVLRVLWICMIEEHTYNLRFYTLF